MPSLGNRVMAALTAFLHPRPRPLRFVRPDPAVPMSPGKLFAGKNVLVTGAGANIGRSIAIEMAREGARVCMTDIDPVRLAAVEADIAASGGSAIGFRSDVSNAADNNALLADLRRREIPVDVLVNNVGIGSRTRPLVGGDATEFRRVMENNLFGPLQLTDLVVKDMREGKVKGNVLFISSIHAWQVARDLPYSASKGALGMALKELAVDLAPFGIRVNGIAPGGVAGNSRPEDGMDADPLRPAIEPVYIARAAVFLASDLHSAHTTGITLTIDGGLSLANRRTEEHPSA